MGEMFMVRRLFLVFMLTIISGQDVCAGPFGIRVEEVIVTTAIQANMPVDSIHAYAASIATLFCYSRITSADSEDVVWHVWYHEGREVSRVSLPVRSKNWKTWSKKAIPATGRGAWHVDVLDAQGRVLGSRRFRLL